MSESPSRYVLETDSDILWHRKAIPQNVIRLYGPKGIKSFLVTFFQKSNHFLAINLQLCRFTQAVNLSIQPCKNAWLAGPILPSASNSPSFICKNASGPPIVGMSR